MNLDLHRGHSITTATFRTARTGVSIRAQTDRPKAPPAPPPPSPNRERQPCRGRRSSAWLYAPAVAVCRFIQLCTIRLYAVRPSIPEQPGGYVLALTHLGHLDPFLSAVFIRRRVVWMTRKEFFSHPLAAWALRRTGAFSVNRQGIPVNSVRHAIHQARAGRAVGICPEGGVKRGGDLVIHGGPLKRGACSIAIRAGVPIVPCVMLGTPQLNEVGPWLPFKRARVWLAYGRPITPPAAPSDRAKRAALAEQLRQAYAELYAELRDRFDIPDEACV
jgi:1-acyl-sn-glycerol-3-phosphate acyltransferase